ncbi:PREDICTED: J domain-containing protein spf31-like [Erythranthe guttata]|uniref:J domain-containing protein spf31-like n=1 Tax=Erythranthe guttata TaxID=4155 RepID=UPI00064DF0AA|nr:PREDICTED: J domain-containing protein spf31-like [Erythranthe guttata]|eukprot:XP_012858795.1 PREDICTED: J domain-containing protein spf31-like [Erythranthe guttata]
MGDNSGTTSSANRPAAATSADEDLLLKNFFAEVSEVERDNEVNRILSCFKLNAFEYLNLPFDSSVDEVKRQYRKLSLLVHPDKCKHPQSKEAFGAIAPLSFSLRNYLFVNSLFPLILSTRSLSWCNRSAF